MLATAMVVACVQPLDSTLKTQGGKYSLALSVRCQDPATKTTIPGEETLHENTITTLDWFIFSSNADNAVAILHDRKSYTDKANVTDPFTVTSQDMEPFIPTTKNFTGYVYVMANLPAAYTHDALAAMSLSQLKQLEISTTLDIRGEDGKFKAQDNFVMASEIKSFTLTESAPQATVLAPLSRVAAKITLDLSVVSAIDEVESNMSGRSKIAETYLQTWYPDVENVHIYLSYGNSRTAMDQTLFGRKPNTYDNTHFFTYNRYGFTPAVTDKGDDGWAIGGTPFYTYPMTWNTHDEHAPFIKIILPWRSYKEEPTYELYDYVDLDHEGNTIQGNKLKSATRAHIDDKSATPQEFYYKISLPFDDNTVLSNTWYKIALDVAILGGRSDDVSMELAGKYYVVDWNTPDVTAGGELTQGSYLSLASPRDTFYIYGGNSIEIPVKSSHDLEVVNENGNRPTGTYYNYTSATPSTGTLTYSTTSAAGNNFTISTGGRSTVTLTHELVADLNSATSRDISTITYKFRIRHANNASSLYKDITVIQYPSIYIESLTPGDAYVDGRKAVAGSAVQTPYYQINYDNAATTIYHVHVSAFNGDSKYYYPRRQNVTPDQQYEYIITDPRVKAGWGAGDIAAYGANNDNTTTWPVETVQNMMVGSSTPNFIAPSFLVSSRWGRPGGGMNFETAKKRCATYQEAGYPAGRWRLPTEAEVYFLFTLQANGLITTLYTTGTGTYGYWASSEYVFGRGYTAGSTPDFRRLAAGQVASIRCVYDTWYWGDKPESRDTYHPGPTIYNN